MKYLQTLFKAQQKLKSSDLHLYEGHPPHLRGAEGGLYPVKNYDVLTAEDMEHIMDEILTPRQKQVFREQRDFELSARLEDVARFRINFYQSYNGVSIVFRMLEEDIASLESLGVPEVVNNIAYEHSGLVLITGPNGSGKSTTLAAILDIMNQYRSVNIITIEDPIEIVHESKKSVITQREVGTHIDSFKNSAKYLFRQDVNVVMVGELRDYESFSLALEIAETGHLVIATVHSEDIQSTISRIIGIFPSEQQNMIRMKLALSLRAIVSQKLLPKIDLSGRVVANEIFMVDDAAKQLILDHKEHQIRSHIEARRESGNQTFNDHILQHYANKHISKEVALLHAKNPEDFISLLDEVDEGLEMMHTE